MVNRTVLRWALVFITSLTVGALVYVETRHAALRMGRELALLTRQITSLEHERVAFLVEREQLTSGSSLAVNAQRMGLRPPLPDERIVVDAAIAKTTGVIPVRIAETLTASTGSLDPTLARSSFSNSLGRMKDQGKVTDSGLQATGHWLHAITARFPK